MQLAQIQLKKLHVRIGDSVLTKESEEISSFLGRVFAFKASTEEVWIHVVDVDGNRWELQPEDIDRIFPQEEE